MNNRLERIIDEAYRVFKPYKASKPLDACTDCCLGREQEDELVSMAIRQIPFDLFYEYNSAAKPTQLNPEEVLHFLPRLLELTAEFRFTYHSAELVLSRMACLNLEEMPEIECMVLMQYAELLVEKALRQYPLPELERMDSIIAMLYNGGFAVEPMLTQWENNGSDEALLHFADLVLDGLQDKNGNIYKNGFADQTFNQTFQNWLKRPQVLDGFKRQLEEVVMHSNSYDSEVVERCSWAYDKLYYGL
ncbi:MAG: hypothetical protein JJ975_00505 [Bacteroidia bacterium]|nr:hypothetical protein [Bacteroidia bacterium]